jgi:cyclophilin family peptidyl-prolyl cis-trans isomerase
MKTTIRLFNLFIVVMMLSTISTCQTDKRTKIIISTEYGDIKVALYDETPQHRDNFIKLVNSGWYNGSIFHRIIRNFMIQGGQGADGKPDPGYTIPAEIVSKYYHKKGALAAARMSDQVNPERKSSGSQFYIVQGKKFTDLELTDMEKRAGKPFTREQRNTYTTIGGAPHLDGAYTVFGEVVAGLDVVDKIASVQTGTGDRPLKDVKMTMKIVK